MNFDELIKANRNNVRNIIRLITKQDNEDLEQEVYIKAWKNSGKYEERGTFKAWINTVAKNVSKDYLKSKQKRYADDAGADDEILNKLKAYSEKLKKQVEAKDARLKEVGYKNY